MTGRHVYDYTKRAEAVASERLRRARHEDFVANYLGHFDGARAAEEAGYPPAVAKRIWPILLSTPTIRARMAYLGKVASVPNTHAHQIARQVAEDVTEGASNLYVTNPFTGEVEVDLSRATESQMRGFGFTRRTVSRGGVTTEVTEVTRPHRLPGIHAIRNRIGLDKPDPEITKSERIQKTELKVIHSFPVLDDDGNVIEITAEGAEYQAWQRELEERKAREKEAARASSAKGRATHRNHQSAYSGGRIEGNGDGSQPADRPASLISHHGTDGMGDRTSGRGAASSEPHPGRGGVLGGGDPGDTPGADGPGCDAEGQGASAGGVVRSKEPRLYDPVRGLSFKFDL